MKTVEDFKRAQEKHDIQRWKIRECSMCEYPLSYLFHNGAAFFDAGCDCVRTPSRPCEIDWQDVVDFYNSQKAPEVVAQFDKHWGFDKEVANDPSSPPN